MTANDYQPDPPAGAMDRMIMAASGDEPIFDTVTKDFLRVGYHELKDRTRRGGLLDFASLGQNHPWLYRLAFRTRGLIRDAEGEILNVDRHVAALRFLPEYLGEANQFEMLRLVEPAHGTFHPNISPGGAICVEIYAGQPLVEICQSLHDLFRWRLRQYDERDALNQDACAWGRENIDRPIDDRPLFGQRLEVNWQSADE